MTFSIVGAGNMAWFLGTRLVAGGAACTGIYGRDQQAATALGSALNAKTITSLSAIADSDADICFLAISDAAIQSIASQLRFRETVLVHTAGAIAIEEITAAAVHCAVFWPVYSILKAALPEHRNIPCAWEATSDKSREYILAAGGLITDDLFEARHDQRKWLHLGAVMSNNFITHLMAICEQICKENNLPFSSLMPIIRQTFERVATAAPHSLQTGPAIRRDSKTTDAQLALLSRHPYWQQVYAAITASIQNF